MPDVTCGASATRNPAARVSRGATVLAVGFGLLFWCGSVVRGAGDARLLDAVRSRSTETAHALLAAGVDPNVAAPDGATALHWAAHWNDLDLARALIKARARVDAQNDLGATPLWVACVQGDGAMVDTLLRAGANPNLA